MITKAQAVSAAQNLAKQYRSVLQLVEALGEIADLEYAQKEAVAALREDAARATEATLNREVAEVELVAALAAVEKAKAQAKSIIDKATEKSLKAESDLIVRGNSIKTYAVEEAASTTKRMHENINIVQVKYDLLKKSCEKMEDRLDKAKEEFARLMERLNG